MRKVEGTPTLTTNFAVKRSPTTESGYTIRRLFPRAGAPRYTVENGIRMREQNTKAPRADMEGALDTFAQHAKDCALEIGKNDPQVQMLRVKTVGFGQSTEGPELSPGGVLMRIDDGKGNAVRFRLNVQPRFIDGKDREWDRVVARIESATLQGQPIQLTYELQHTGMIFLSHGMQDILKQTQEGKQPTMTTRQETDDHVCFPNGHHGVAGTRRLACHCDEERQASLDAIHQRGGINCLIPGAGNGLGGERQDIQVASNTSRVLTGKEPISYPENYNRQGVEGDKRNTSIKISTLLMEHLFQTKHIPNITTLTESRDKQNVWHEFGGAHTVTGESLHITPPDHLDSRKKQDAYGYIRPEPPLADEMPWPFQPRS